MEIFAVVMLIVALGSIVYLGFAHELSAWE